MVVATSVFLYANLKNFERIVSITVLSRKQMRIVFLMSLICFINVEAKYSLEELERMSAAHESLKKQKIDAESGDAKAQFLEGLFHQFGYQGYKRDMVTALFWYNKSAMGGNANALFNLGACYEEGEGVAQSLSEAYAYYTLAQSHGRRDGIREALERVEARLSFGEKIRAKARSKELYYVINPAAKEADIKRQKDDDERKAAQARLDAQNKEIAIKERARLLDETKALADRGDPEAEFMIGCYYATGQEPRFPRDDQESVAWFLKAAMQGHATAQYRLGLCYFSGKGVVRDVVQSYAFFDVAGDYLKEAREVLSTIQTNEMTVEQLMAGPRRSRELRKQIEAFKAKKSGK